MATDKVNPIPLQTFDTAGFVAGFNLFYELPYAVFNLVINNKSDHYFYVSFDGIDSHLYIKPSERRARSYQEANRAGNFKAFLPKGTRIYLLDDGGLKGGNVYLSGWYSKE